MYPPQADLIDPPQRPPAEPVPPIRARLSAASLSSGRHIAGMVEGGQLTYNDFNGFAWFTVAPVWRILQFDANPHPYSPHGLNDAGGTYIMGNKKRRPAVVIPDPPTPTTPEPETPPVVTPPPDPDPTPTPTITLTPRTGNVGGTFTAQVTDAPALSRVEWADGTYTDVGSGPLTHVYSAAGEFVAHLTLADAALATAPAVVVSPVAPPAPAPTIYANPNPAQVGQAVTFSIANLAGAGGPSQGAIYVVFGDGSAKVAATSTVAHQYTKAGTFQAYLEQNGAPMANVAPRDVVVQAAPDGVPEWFNRPWLPPLVITKGGKYTGNYRSTDPAVPAITIKTGEAVTLENVRTDSKGHHIAAPYVQVDLTARNIHSIGRNPDVAGKNHGRWFLIEEFKRFDLQHAEGEKTSGIYLRKWNGTASQGTTVRVSCVKHKNIEGRYSDGKGGYQSNFYRLQTLQFNNVNGIPNVLIDWVYTENNEGESHVEDNFNFYASSGLPGNPITVAYCMVNGAHGNDPSLKYSGGGFIVGDGSAGAHFRVHHCGVVRSDNYSFANAGAPLDVVFEDNREASTGRWKDGRISAQSNDAGYYNRNYGERTDWQASTIIFRRNYAAHSKPTQNNPKARWDYSISGGTLCVDTDNAKYQPTTAVVPDSECVAVLDWFEQMRAEAGVTIGLI